MPPKKGKGGGKKKQVKEDKDVLPEVDKEFYEIQITDLNKKLVRLRSKCGELEAENETIRSNMKTLDEDRADVIAHLKRSLQAKVNEINELSDRLTALTEARETEQNLFTLKVKNMETDYKEMREQLSSEIKLLEGKLNSLEEFRAHREELVNKFEVQEQQIKDQENRHAQMLYDVEMKFVIIRDELRKEMETKLLQLSIDFQKATQTRIASTTQGVIKENIAINNELNILITAWQTMYEEYETLKQNCRTTRTLLEITIDEKEKALTQNLLQSKVIDRLAYEHKKLHSIYSEWAQYDKVIQQLNKRMEAVSLENSKYLHLAKQYQTAYDSVLSEMAKAIAERKQAQQKNFLLEQGILQVLDIATRYFDRAAGVETETTEHRGICRQAAGATKHEAASAKSAKSSLSPDACIKDMFQLLRNVELTTTQVKSPNASVDTILDLRADTMYTTGDLGIMPKLDAMKEAVLASDT